jgi:hypothetical protein
MTEGFRPKLTITNCIITELTCIERTRGVIEAAVLSEKWVQALAGQNHNGIRLV